MPTAARHAKPTTPATRRRAPYVAAATLAGVAAVFVSLHSGSAAPKASAEAIAVTRTGSDSTAMTTAAVVGDITAAKANMVRQAARRRHLAQRRAAQRRAARQQAQQAAAQAPPSTAPPPPSSGGDAAHSALGVCIRNAEEGGSYAWGPGNGGGAYQFALGTWEAYGGAASEFGVAGPAYQDQIFDNAIAAGGASNWTNYDGC